MNSPSMFWDGVVRRLQAEAPSFVIDAWVRPLTAEACGEGVRLICPSALHRERVRERFLPRIQRLAAIEAGGPVEIDLQVSGKGKGRRGPSLLVNQIQRKVGISDQPGLTYFGLVQPGKLCVLPIKRNTQACI